MSAGRIPARRSLVPLVVLAVLSLVLLAQPASSFAAPEVLLKPAAWNFGEQTVGTESEPVTFELENISKSEILEVSNVEIPSANFGFEKYSCPGKIGPEQSCVIKVRFTPQTAGAKLSGLIYEYVGGVRQAELIGTGVAPEPHAKAEPGTIEFGEQVIGGPSTPRDVTITNDGTASLKVTELPIVGSNQTDFVIGKAESTPCPAAPFTLAKGESCKVAVSFKPGVETGEELAELIVETEKANQPVVQLRGIATAAALEITPPKKDFGEVLEGGRSPKETFTVENIGTAKVVLNEPNINGGGESFVREAGTCEAGTELLPEGTCTVGVLFEPQGVGPFKGQLAVSGSGATAIAELEGVGK